MPIREGYLEKRVFGEADDGAVREDTAVGRFIVRLALLQHEVASTKVRDKRLQFRSILTATVEEGTEPGTHRRLRIIARL